MEPAKIMLCKPTKPFLTRDSEVLVKGPFFSDTNIGDLEDRYLYLNRNFFRRMTMLYSNTRLKRGWAIKAYSLLKETRG